MSHRPHHRDRGRPRTPPRCVCSHSPGQGGTGVPLEPDASRPADQVHERVALGDGAILGEEHDDVLRAGVAPRLARVRADGVLAARVGDVEDERVRSTRCVDERLVDLRSHGSTTDDDDGAFRVAHLDGAVTIGTRHKRVAVARRCGCWRGRVGTLLGEQPSGHGEEDRDQGSAHLGDSEGVGWLFSRAQCSPGSPTGQEDSPPWPAPSTTARQDPALRLRGSPRSYYQIW